MRRQTASERFRRIVAVVPWIAERDGPRIDDVCDRFGIDRPELLADLDIVFMVGIPPYTPDELIDVMIDDDRVWITLGRYFTRPLQLSAHEALAVLAAGAGLMAITGAEAEGPLARALDKLRASVGLTEGASTLDVSLGGGDAEVLTTLRDGLAARTSIDIDYYSHSTDASRTRRIDPYRVYATEGAWYVVSWCHLAQAERLFRVDRIRSATATGERYELPDRLPPAISYFGSGRDRRIALEIDPAARWITEHYPTESVTELDDGRARVVLAVGGEAWLERLLIRLGPEATVVDPPPGDPTADDPEGWVDRDEARRLVRDAVEGMLTPYRG